ncbi:hypothetical protein X737_28990 [Mesorhizobium sp. L48C026A00]|nr:hypothetical protein X737_28990 [Mesorhizobium sp. L48C026A00]
MNGDEPMSGSGAASDIDLAIGHITDADSRHSRRLLEPDLLASR